MQEAPLIKNILGSYMWIMSLFFGAILTFAGTSMLLGILFGRNDISIDSILGGTLTYAIGIGTLLFGLGVKRKYGWALKTIKTLAMFSLSIVAAESIYFLVQSNVDSLIVLVMGGILSLAIPVSLLVYYFSSRVKNEFSENSPPGFFKRFAIDVVVITVISIILYVLIEFAVRL